MDINESVIKGLVTCKRKRNIYSEPIVLGTMDGDEIPEWLLIEVLIRLPVKLILRLKLVCKHWLSLILDPSFVRMYISRASLLQQSWVIVCRFQDVEWSRRSGVSVLPCESVENIYCRELKRSSYLPLHLPLPRYPCSRFRPRIYGISNGLALCARIVPSTHDPCEPTALYDICNPVTKQRITLVPPACQYDKGSFGFLTQVEDGMLKSYRVVCVDLCFQTPNTIRFHVFFSESRQWKIFSVLSDQEIEILGDKPPAELHGNLHWILHQNGILAYDPYRKPNGFRIIPSPRHENEEYHDKPWENTVTSICGVSDGKLRYYELCGKTRRGFSIWILNDYSSGDWSLQNRVSYNDIRSDTVLCCRAKIPIFPIIFDPFDPDIVYLGHMHLIVPYNIKTKRSVAPGANELIIKHGPYPEGFWVCWGTALLFSIPPWPTSIYP